MRESDRHWMAQALALGATAEGATSPNPRVGCLIVRDGQVVGRGRHCAAGQAHAEALALADAAEGARGATLYVNLEPCAHHGRTPPCSDLVAQSGVRRVVVALQDPDPRVDGRGFARLREAGVQLEVGLLSPEAARLNEAFVHWHRRGLPLVTLKAASSLDGMLSAAAGESRWITGPAARRFVHRLRWRHDAVLVGAGTVRRDDPRLTVRLGQLRAARQRVVLSNSLEIDPRSRIFGAEGPESHAVRIYTASTDRAAVRRLAGSAEVVRMTDPAGGLDLEGALRDLAGRGVQSLLVEGGAKTFASFLEHGLVHRVAIFQAPRLLGGRGGTPLLDRPTVPRPVAGWSIRREQSIPLGSDLLWFGALEPSGEA